MRSSLKKIHLTAQIRFDYTFDDLDEYVCDLWVLRKFLVSIYFSHLNQSEPEIKCSLAIERRRKRKKIVTERNQNSKYGIEYQECVENVIQ